MVSEGRISYSQICSVKTMPTVVDGDHEVTATGHVNETEAIAQALGHRDGGEFSDGTTVVTALAIEQRAV